MAKTLFYRLFGVGKIPANVMAEIEQEGILLLDEGVKGSVTYRNFHAPGRYAAWERRGFSASIAVTKVRLLALAYTSPVINVPFADERIQAMRYSLKHNDTLCITFDADLFHADWSGTIEYRFRTAEAQHCLELLQH